MRSIYFLPYTGIPKFDGINNKIREKLSAITAVESLFVGKESNYFNDESNLIAINVVFIPTVFDYRNAVAYQGVDFAISIYLQLISSGQNHATKIVLLGIEEKVAFFENCFYSNFLKCPNVEYLQNSLQEIELFLSKNQNTEFNKKEAINKLKSVGIKPPTSYKTHHSIANEWSILRWAQAIQLDKKKIEELSNIEKGIENLYVYP